MTRDQLMSVYGACTEKEAEATLAFVGLERNIYCDQRREVAPKVAPVVDRFCHDGGLIVFATDVPRAKPVLLQTQPRSWQQG